MWLYWGLAVLELDYRCAQSSSLSHLDPCLSISYFPLIHTTDSADVLDSDFFKDSDPESGLGGWGDASLDYSVTTGAFSTFQISYPNPHILRRNFSLQPWADLGSLDGFNPYPLTYANSTFTYKNISRLINDFVGDYVGFQKLFEQTQGAHGTLTF